MDLIETFVHTTSTLDSPEIFRRWGAVYAASAAMSRRCWTIIRGADPIYPNLYVLLVGPPGTGKTDVVMRVKPLLRGTPGVNVGPDKLTQRRLLNRMALTPHEGQTLNDMLSAARKEGRECSLAAIISEVGSFIPSGDLDFMSVLSDLYDCPEEYDYETQHVGEDHLINVCLSFLIGAQPAWFAEGLPSDAFERGFPARLILVFHGITSEAPLFTGVDSRWSDVPQRLKAISHMRGYMPFSEPAREAFQAWRRTRYAPVPNDPLLMSYSRRRRVHVAKISMAIAAGRHPHRMSVDRLDFEAAKGLLIETEKGMPAALAAAGGNIYKLREEAVCVFVKRRYLDTHAPVAEWEIRRRLAQVAPPHLQDVILDNLILQQALQVGPKGKAPHRMFMPGGIK